MSHITNWLLKIFLASYLLCISNGLTSKLIYRDSPYFPLYNSNLSDLEAFHRDIQTSRTRASNLIMLTKFETNTSSFLAQDSLPLSLIFREPLFIVEVGIGTPTTKARLVFDTIAPLTWTQCKPCARCFEQEPDYPIFDPARSKSFNRTPSNRTIFSSLGCTGRDCYYQVATGDGLASEGRLSMDTFVFRGQLEALKNVVFGCGTRNVVFRNHYTRMKVTGVLGMGNYPTSVPNQLGDQITRRFSYCIPTLRSSETKRTELTFGKAAPFANAKNVQATGFLPQTEGPLLRKSSYKLKLLGISLAGKRLEMPHGSFNDGITIDVGTPFSMINKQAYNVVVNAISSYFSQWKNIKQVVNKKFPGKICYKYPKGFTDFPSMILHFEGANLEVNGTNLFMFGSGNVLRSNFICLQMLEGRPDILGVYQQQNVRFEYDLDNKKILFAKEDC